MRKFARNALVTGAAAAATVALAGGPAFADHGHWDIDNPATTGTNEVSVAVTATSTNSKLTNKGNTLTCAKSVASGTVFDDLHSGSTALDHVGNITSTTWTTCTGPGGLTFNVSHGGTWKLWADSQSGSVITGRLTNVSATISGLFCNATVTGTAHGTYDNNTGVLTINEPEGGTLVVSAGASCLGLISAGDKPAFSGSYTVSPRVTINHL